MRYAHTHTHTPYMVLPITRKYAKSLCDKFNKVPKRYAASADGWKAGEGGRGANKMKINCATRKKSKDFQGAHTDKQPKNISSASSPLLLALLFLLSPLYLPPSLPPLTTYLWLPSVWRLCWPSSTTQGIRTCVQQPPLKRKGQHTTTRAQESCRCVCVGVWVCMCCAHLGLPCLKFKLSLKQNIVRSCSCCCFRFACHANHKTCTVYACVCVCTCVSVCVPIV